VELVAHHHVGGDIDGEHCRELLQALNDPAAPVLEIPAGVVSLAAEIRTAAAGIQGKWVSRR
jgi:hypothetical protein